MAPLTSAERQRKYREKLKKENPEKYENLKKINLERTKKNYKRIQQLPEFKQKEQRKQWRQRKRNKKEGRKNNETADPKIEQTDENEKRKALQRCLLLHENYNLKVTLGRMRKARSLLLQENLNMKDTVERMTKIARSHRITLDRYKKRMENIQQLLNKEFEELRTLDFVTTKKKDTSKMPRKKTNFSYITKNSKRLRLVRILDSQEQREERVAEARERQARAASSADQQALKYEIPMVEASTDQIDSETDTASTPDPLEADGSETDEEDESELNELALKVTLARIKSNPQLYIGIPKNCYHLVQILHKQSGIFLPHILLCLKKIKLDTNFEELADQFGMTTTSARTVFTSCVPTIANSLQSFIFNTNTAQSKLPVAAKATEATCVLDSLKLKVNKKDDNLGKDNTVHYVISSCPDGFINYVSTGYGGKSSDDKVLEDTGYLNRYKPGTRIITTDSLDIEELLIEKGMELIKHEKNSRLAGHVEKIVNRVRRFAMVTDQRSVDPRLLGVLDESVVITCALINLQSSVYFVN